MLATSLVMIAALSVLPTAQQADTDDRQQAGASEERTVDAAWPDFDLRTAMAEAVARVVAEDLGLQVVQRPASTPGEMEEAAGTPYFQMLYGNSYDPAVLAFFAASVAEMYSASDLRTQCEESAIVTCSDPFPGTVQQDALITAGVYAGVTALQRLAKTQWGVDLDEGWKNVLVWGGIAAVRGLIAGQNMSDANALRDLGR